MSDNPIIGLLSAALFTFVGAFLAEPILLAFARIFGIYAIVQERTCRVYMLFGKVVGVIDLAKVLGITKFAINVEKK